MTDQELIDRISADPRVLAGKPTIRGTRLSVEFIVSLLAHGASTGEVLTEYPDLTEQDVQACLLFAAQSLSRTAFMPRVPEHA